MTSPGAHGIDTRSLLSWFSRAGRPLPWREDGVSAWEILLCEVMSQQTPVTRVEPVWREWLARWPGPAELATASPAEVIRMWGKLGYPRRALRLRECAVVVVDTFGGEVPTDVEDLLSLPGVGDYTARAVACFAHGQAVPVVDTNVRRVVARAVNGVAEAGPPSIRRDLAAVEALLPDDREEAVAFSVAMMELGALVCTARSPDCDACPLAASCAWVAGGRPAWDGPRRRAQTYAGTDRQVRGLLLDVLRDGDGTATAARLDAVWPDALQRGRALASLVDDGLMVRVGDRYSLPG
ncbi:A/G-specific adenine glycosylase [Dietzia cinnamea]|uniref:Adenine DNA glycosylase n=2 Tax=Dietzia TaxID=37914 RepID=A0AAW5QBB6_9ACTN|nr:A/G-specific adenine glycosylase [Dietzia cinnamea]MCT1640902.1 A/G-specific adenine glycosylase [Dietzia cinnamea]MCT1865133.1 A/G-specific adenine glycosylase [Dietzia cinnamea]MCT1886044.1 A/G-specific adenine glycosylase [Dietzia cinnamea]MCT2030986.1 A/G-specific adenine glycosylase [Dietzia cinnamea]MCT2034522.1 A/G-specific adenine glycosylase [Dietzia cinnamea]